MLPSVFEIFELLEFDSIFKSYDNLEKARTDFARDRKIESRVANLTEMEGKKSLTIKRVEIKPEVKAESKPVGSENLEQKIKRIVIQNPFLTISEIKYQLNLEQDRTLGFWQLFKILSKNKLLRRRNRFRLSWEQKNKA